MQSARNAQRDSRVPKNTFETSRSDNNKIIGIVLARLDSKRLPQKALLSIGNHYLFEICISRLARSTEFSSIVLATTTREVDDPLAIVAKERNIPVFRGSADNVASRCVECARYFGAHYFLRLNADSPFSDPSLIKIGVAIARKNPDCDLVTNLIGRSFPYGISVEIVRSISLENQLEKLSLEESEHVTQCFYRRSADFYIKSIVSGRPDLKQARMTVDDKKDLAMLRRAEQNFKGQLINLSHEEIAEFYISHHHTNRNS